MRYDILLQNDNLENDKVIAFTNLIVSIKLTSKYGKPYNGDMPILVPDLYSSEKKWIDKDGREISLLYGNGILRYTATWDE